MLRRGDTVEVRSAAEILATLDEHGRLEGVPFMPEMLPYLGRRYTVAARVERACDTAGKTGIRRMRDTVLLGDLRCDGKGHGGCQAACRLYWKEAWLRPVAQGPPGPEPPDAHDAEAELAELGAADTRAGDGIYRCQATELRAATEPLGFWNAGSFLRELTTRNVPVRRFVSVLVAIVVEELRRRLGRWSPPVSPRATGRPDPPGYNLRPGALITVRTQREIEATLDANSKTRGLFFDREMLPYCGETHTVIDRIERFIDEASGEMIELKSDCLVLDGAFCSGLCSYGRWFCPRGIYSWWREDWLRPT
jgi:hypothetical protein